ncbi:MAG TPA: dihydrolipoamide acetyltransferase family protein [Myxococcota bacterium]|nr:dihydrolipoamide acetyltransferase family protein [Myxococcota bacterium]
MRPSGPGADFASPVVRRLLREHNVELQAIRGSGRNGRVTRDDVMGYLRGPAAAAPVTSKALSVVSAPAEAAPLAPAPLAQAPLAAASAAAAATPAGAGLVPFLPTVYRPPRVEPHEGDEVIPFTRRRRIIAEHMVYSKITSPHVATVAEVDMHKVSLARAAPRPAGQGKPSFLAYLCTAAVRALRDHPRLNSAVARDALVVRHSIHLGVAVDAEEGLVVPVVKHADRHTVEGLGAAIDELAAKARAGKLTADDLSGGTFTVSNPGREGNLFGVSIINQPQVAILRMGELVKRPVVVTAADGEDHIVVHPMMHLCLSYDHRVIDGVAANRFLYSVRQRLEKVDL